MSANKNGQGPQESRLQNWIEHELLHLAMHGQEEGWGVEIPDRNLSLRVPVTIHLMLARLAQKLGRSKTACAEEILSNAVKDVYAQFQLSPLSVTDIEEQDGAGEKAASEKG